MHNIGQFIYPWSSGHFSRMMRFHEAFSDQMKEEFETHSSSKGQIYQKILEKFTNKSDKINNI